MRILYVLTDADIGGAEAMVETQALARRPEDSVELVVLMEPGSMSGRLEKAFDQVHYLAFPPSSRNLPGMVRALERAAAGFRPDVVHSHLFHADLVTLLARIPQAAKVTTIHTQGFSKADHPLTRLIARTVGLLSHRFDAAVPTGAACLEFGRRYRYRRLTDPIDNTAPIPEASTYDPETKLFLSLARWHPVKGHPVLFRAFRTLLEDHPDWSLACVGPGAAPDNADAARAVREAGLENALADGRLQLRGPTADVSGVLAEAGALVISSLYGETFPVVGVEANAAGVPVIAADVGQSGRFVGAPEHLVPAGDATALARAMKNFAALDSRERTQLSGLVRRRAETDFSPDAAAARYREVYRAAMARRNRSRKN